MKNDLLLSVIAVLLALVACSPARPAASDALTAPAEAPVVRSPKEIVELFLSAWNASDFTTMYSYLSSQSRSLYAPQVFQARYDVVHKDINFNGLTYSIGEISTQGATAIVKYDLKIRSSLYGDIEDPGRTMRLVQSGSAWQVAWTTMDIFEGLVGGARISVQTRFPARGSIYDRDGNYIVQENGTMVTLYSRKDNMRNVDACIDLLARVLRRQRRDLVRFFADYLGESRFYLGEVDLDTYNRQRGDLENVCAVELADQRQTRAYYGYGALAHITGYIGQVPADQLDVWEARGYRSGDLVGLAGIENVYQPELAGRPERFLRITEPGGTRLRELGNSIGEPSTPLMLTVRLDLQIAAAQALNDAFNYAEPNWGGIAVGASAVVLDVNTGAILALASYPTFNPTLFNPTTPQPNATFIGTLVTDPREPLINKATQKTYFPGSVYKIVTTAAAANEGLIGPDELFSCGLEWPGGALYGDVLPSRADWRKADGLPPAGDITITRALTSSCDPFFYEMGARLFLERGPNTIVEYSELMGLGKKIGLPMPEAEGNLAPPRTVGDAINNAIGQGNVQLPPIQMAQLVAAVANGGTLYKPYIVQQVGGMDNTEVEQRFQPTIIRTIEFNDGVMDIIKKGMCDVVTDRSFGTAELVFRGAPYTVCGKTGTAQTARYPNAWFVAYAPAQNPEIAIVVMAEATREGSEVAAPIVRRILDYYFNAPVAPFPEWWNKGPYVPLVIPEGGTGGG